MEKLETILVNGKFKAESSGPQELIQQNDYKDFTDFANDMFIKAQTH
jgi:hypothetical protein